MKLPEAIIRQLEPLMIPRAALDLAAHGFPIFPCRADKAPLTTHGFKDATTDENTVRTWWGRHRDAAIGIATGAAHVVVIDVDVKNGAPGLENWKSLVDELGLELEATAIARTPSGGLHLYYDTAEADLHISCTTGRLAEGIDVRAEGGYVIAPPSLGSAGGAYEWLPGHSLDAVLAPLPEALAKRLQTASPRTMAASVDTIPEGQRNGTLASLAGSMRRRGMGEEAIVVALLETNSSRCSPPLADDEVRGIARSVARYEPAKVSTPASSAEPRAPSATNGLPIISAAELATTAPASPPAIVAGYVYANALTDLAAQPKKGKTTVLVALAKSVCLGQRFLDLPTQRGPVVYLTEEQQATFLSALRRVGGDRLDNLYVGFRRDAFGMSWTEVCAEVRAHCERLGAVLVIVDTLSDWAGIRGDEENSAGAALEAVRPLREMAELPRLGVVVARHERKSGGEVGQAARGSSAFTGAVDVVLSLRNADGRNRRKLIAISRFDGTPDELVLELVDGVFVSRGAVDDLRLSTQERAVLGALASTREEAVVAAQVAERVEELSDATVRRVLKRLVDEGEVIAERGVVADRQKTALGYWRRTEVTP